jgi:hypothetical protein
MAWPATQHWPSVASSTARTSSKLSPNITTFANAPPNLWTALTLMSGVFTGMTMVACTWVFVARTHACVVCVCVCVCVCGGGVCCKCRGQSPKNKRIESRTQQHARAMEQRARGTHTSHGTPPRNTISTANCMTRMPNTHPHLRSRVRDALRVVASRARDHAARQRGLIE